MGQEVVGHHRGLALGTLEVGVLLDTFSREFKGTRVLIQVYKGNQQTWGFITGDHWISRVPCPILGSQFFPAASALVCSPRS